MLNINIKNLSIDYYTLSFWCGDSLRFIGGKFSSEKEAWDFIDTIDIKFYNNIVVEPVYNIKKLLNYVGRSTWL